MEQAIPASSSLTPSDTESRFPVPLMCAVATMYYLEDATQAEIAARLGTSRATISRLLTEARRRGIVRIEVVPPTEADDENLAERAAEALGLKNIYLVPSIHPSLGGASLAPALSTALLQVGLVPGDVLLVSSGRTVYEVAQTDLPALPGVVLAPTIGGHDEPESWYQPNEITRQLAAKVGGTPTFLFAPAVPSPGLLRSLRKDEASRRVFELWSLARCVVLGVGAPPLTRQSLPRFMALDMASLRASVGDVCSRFYDSDGRPVRFPGSDRLVAIDFDALRRIPVSIAVAYGLEKVPAIVTGAHARYFNQLVTDVPTATALLAASDAG